MILNETYWDSRYKEGDIRWDLGATSPSLKAYFDQLVNKEVKILIPGGGNSYEAEYLHYKGFKNVYVVDLSETALINIKERVPSFPSAHLIHQNFFDINFQCDLIIEQTFFCAIDPSLRNTYVAQTAKLLTGNGKIVGLFFNVPLNETHPPFGGHKEVYLKLFSPFFNIQIMEGCYNSHESREGKELFVKLLKK